MGSDDALDQLDNICDICKCDELSKEVLNDNMEKLFNNKNVIATHYHLILCYQIMKYGANLYDSLRKFGIDACELEEFDSCERKERLSEYKSALINYKNGHPFLLPEENLFDIIPFY